MLPTHLTILARNPVVEGSTRGEAYRFFGALGVLSVANGKRGMNGLGIVLHPWHDFAELATHPGFSTCQRLPDYPRIDA